MKYRKIKFGDACELVRGISYKSSDYSVAEDPDAEVFINLKCVTKDGFRNDGIKYYKGDHKNTQSLTTGDLLIANTDLTRNRAVIGNSILVPALDRSRACFSMDLCKINITDSSKLDKFYLYYYLKSPKARWYMINHSDGSTVVHLSTSSVSEMEMEVPSIEEQKKIVSILSSIDRKIACNNRTNDNLDKLLKLKFNDWVDNLSNARLSNLAEIATYRNGLAMQKYRPKNGNGLPVIKIKEMNSGFSKETERCDETIDEDYIVHDGDVLFAWSGTLCAMIWSSGDGGLNQHIFKVTSEKYPKWFYYLWTLRHLDKFIQIAAGKATTMGHIKRKELSLSEVLVPEDNEIKNMDKIMTPILDKIIENNIENRRLTKLRDTLIPELLNGKIDISNIDI